MEYPRLNVYIVENPWGNPSVLVICILGWIFHSLWEGTDFSEGMTKNHETICYNST